MGLSLFRAILHASSVKLSLILFAKLCYQVTKCIRDLLKYKISKKADMFKRGRNAFVKQKKFLLKYAMFIIFTFREPRGDRQGSTATTR